jgi:hypothetical protein
MLSPDQIRKMAGETLLAESTVRRWALGKRVNPATDQILLRTAAELGFVKDNEVPSDES